MKLLADIDGEKYELRIRLERERVFAEIDGRAVEVYVRESEGGGYLLIIDGRVYDCRVGYSAAQPERSEVRVRNRAYTVTLADPKRLRASASAAAHDDGSAQIIAQMPGKVVRVHVEAGAEVEAGDAILVVEAMKMQNEMKSPKAGTVTILNAVAGETVNAGEVLAVIE
ncbi:MAG: biotin/lipoyl-binding protein [Pyrinomonadaceae bacterium]|nr:biotin/lipoyl-binding protein [Pyrinomonadaceae bacterium]